MTMTSDSEDAIALSVRAGGLRSLARALQVVAAVLGVASIVGGIALIQHTDEASVFFVDNQPTHPYVATGVVVIVAGILQSVWIVAVARTMEIVGGYVWLRSRKLFYDWSADEGEDEDEDQDDAT
jgi:hypothetical protein